MDAFVQQRKYMEFAFEQLRTEIIGEMKRGFAGSIESWIGSSIPWRELWPHAADSDRSRPPNPSAAISPRA